MSPEEALGSNLRQYTAALNGTYLTTRLLTHNGVTIAFALRKTKNSDQFFFDYSLLNSADSTTEQSKEPGAKGNSQDQAGQIDSETWFENVKTLQFAAELRVIGEEAVPVYQIPALDPTGRPINVLTSPEKLSPWLSTSLSLTNPNVTNFEVLSDGKYIYLFRQSRASTDILPNRLMTQKEKGYPPINSNLLCDRFNLVGGTLNRVLEVRYRRSRQKRFPLNEHDTLSVRDINDSQFYEPTFSIRFIQNLSEGRFTVLLIPTATNDVYKWTFFAYSILSQSIEYFTADVAGDGLFDIHGKIYYTCSSDKHEKVFATSPGSCIAATNGSSEAQGGICGQAKQAIIPKGAISETALTFSEKETPEAVVKLERSINLCGEPFLYGFTIEAWVAPLSFWRVEGASPNSDLPPSGSLFCLFSQDKNQQQSSPSIYLDDQLKIQLRYAGSSEVLMSSPRSLKLDDWSHVAITYETTSRTYAIIINGVSNTTPSYKLPSNRDPGSIGVLASQDGISTYNFQGRLDEIRVWKYPLHANTVRTKMSTRATGIEPLLAACWHLDEGSGNMAYDATGMGCHIRIDNAVSHSALWTKSTAPILCNVGLSKKVLRLAPDVKIVGGIGSTIYYEQITNESGTPKDGQTQDSSPLKRGARLLLSFVAAKGSIQSSLAILDLGLLVDGTICDTPATLQISGVALSDNPDTERSDKKASLLLCHKDAHGIEVFGGMLAFEEGRCGTEPPCLWDSATGSVTIYYRSSSGTFSALSYNISRSEILSANSKDATQQSYYLFSPARSTALQVSDLAVYTMLEDPVSTAATNGLAFESWINVERTDEVVIAAYTSEKLARSEQSKPEQSTFVLAIPASSKGKDKFSLIANANGSLFSIVDESLKIGKWFHLACSSRNVFAVQFSGSNYVDLGTAPEWNVSDFTLVFTLQIDRLDGEQILFTKAGDSNGKTPLQLSVMGNGALCLIYHAEKKAGSNIEPRTVISYGQLRANVAYKIFVSRAKAQIPVKDATPIFVQNVTMRAWDASGFKPIDVTSPSDGTLTEKDIVSVRQGAQQEASLAQSNDSPLSFGGAPWTVNSNRGLVGSIGSVRLYSTAIKVPDDYTTLCAPNINGSKIGSWSCRDPGGVVLIDDTERNNGKLREEPKWILSPYEPDLQKTVFINGKKVKPGIISERVLPSFEKPLGPHQLTIGNIIDGDDVTRFVGLGSGFKGQLDEFRIWNVPRTHENITDNMNSRLSEVPSDMAVYLPFDVNYGSSDNHEELMLKDASMNCWHLTALKTALTGSDAAKLSPAPKMIESDAPVSYDAPCVNHVLGPTQNITKNGAQIRACPSIAEYGDVQIGANGGLEGSFKRAYTYIDTNGMWNLVTGFRIGSLFTEWVSQVQTAPTLIGFIEGAPPIPSENYIDKDKEPSTSIKFTRAEKCVYSYSSERDMGAEMETNVALGTGVKWEVSAGLGVETEVTSGEIKAGYKAAAKMGSSAIRNEVASNTTNTALEMRVELTGTWHEPSDTSGQTFYEAANTGLALVESEVADIFALRLKVGGPVAPLVGYQMRPNFDIPKDRNLVSFPINPRYTKQGCLDGRYGLTADEHYPATSQAPKDASYYKPLEAYALKNRIRRQQEQLQGEYDSISLVPNPLWSPPQRTSRNICNSYVWTADGGTYQETMSSMDFVQVEVGGNTELSAGFGAESEGEISVGGLITFSMDALMTVHTNLMQTKDQNSETSFELQADFPPALDIRQRAEGKKLVKRPGAVDTYRWMSFWLEPSTDATDTFFQQVVDEVWLNDASEPNAKLLLQLRESLKTQPGNARTKAWRVLHRVTYISRVPEAVSRSVSQTLVVASTQQGSEVKKAALMADISCNWFIVQTLDPYVRGARSRQELSKLASPWIKQYYPRIIEQPKFHGQLLDMMGDYIGLS